MQCRPTVTVGYRTDFYSDVRVHSVAPSFARVPFTVVLTPLFWVWVTTVVLIQRREPKEYIVEKGT